MSISYAVWELERIRRTEGEEAYNEACHRAVGRNVGMAGGAAAGAAVGTAIFPAQVHPRRCDRRGPRVRQRR